MSANEVLRTRLLVPPVREDLVARPRLLARLDEILTRRLALVSAPAGYGKTTLLAMWARAGKLPVAWLSVDQGDNDPARFVSYLCAALQTIPALAGEPLLEAVQPEAARTSGVAASLEAVQTSLLNRLASVPDDFVLVLDDYHLITAQAVQQFVATLLERLPPQAHVIIASRADPALPLPRLRARGELVELRLAQLRFTMEEVETFLKQVAGLRLSGAEIAALAGRTEGWAAGLQMAALSIQGRSDPAGFVRDFAGSNRFILDYLMEEVLERQPAAIQEFLLATSILQRMSAGLAYALFQDETDSRLEPDAADLLPFEETLATLERSNLFVIPLDDRREWYRYHHLFADLLVKRIHQTRPGQVAGLHRRASRWLERHGMTAEAIEHALLAGEAERAANLIEVAAEEVLMRGEVSTLLGWVRRLPGEEFIASRPRLDLYAVAATVILGEDLTAIESGMARLKCRSETASETDALRAYLALMAARPTTAERLARRSLDQMPAGTTFFRSLAEWILSSAIMPGSTLDQRIEILETALARSRSAGNRMAWANALCALANVRLRQGRLDLARSLYQEAIQVATGPDGRLLPIAGEALIGLGHVLREWNELDEAVRHLEQGIELIRQVRVVGAIEGLLSLAWCRQAQGDSDAARRLMDEVRRTARLWNTVELDERLIDFYDALLRYRQGEPTAILRYFEAGRTWKNAADIDERDLSRIEAHLQKYERVAWARACLATGRPADALAEMDSLLPAMRDEGRLVLVTEIELIRALTLLVLGRPAEAQAAFEAALAAGEVGNLVRLFVDEGPVVVPLLQNALRTGSYPAYAARLLEALGVERPGEAVAAPARPGRPGSDLVEPLSTREMEVLGLLASSLPAKEIAERLSVAESTINSHTKSIYGKLGVHSRLEAVEKARSLGLL